MSDPRSVPARFRRAFARTGLVCLAVLGGPSCDDHLIGAAAPIGLGCTREPPLTYDNFGKGILARHCGACHSDFIRGNQRGAAPIGIDFNKWDYVLQWADRINVRAVDELTMPPTGTMVPLEREMLGEWMRCDVLPQIGEVQLTTSEEGAS